MRALTALLSVALSALVLLTAPRAQCTTAWLPGGPLLGADWPVIASTMWDPDGAGPLAPVLAIGGDFTAAGGAASARVAVYDPSSGTWAALGSGMDGRVIALQGMPNGDLVAAGWFTQAGGVAANAIARWDGSSWSPLGGGLTSVFYPGPWVWDLALLQNGDLVAGGKFDLAGGATVNSIARWDGSAWHPLGSGMAPTFGQSDVFSLAVLQNGNLVAGGTFAGAGGVNVNGLAQWDGAGWSTVGTGTWADNLLVLSNGDLLMSSFLNVYRWDGATWSQVGPWLGGAVGALAELGNGDIVAAPGGTHWTGQSVINGVMRFDGASWSPMGQMPDKYVRRLTVLPGGDLVAVGDFTKFGNAARQHIARWDGSAWAALGPGTNGGIAAITTLHNGDVVVAGGFTEIGGVAANHIARWDGASWHPLGNGITWPSTGGIFALTVLQNGDLIAGGAFSNAGTILASSIARWDGSTWHGVGGGVTGGIWALLELPNGDLVAGGGISLNGTPVNLVKWDGSAWTALFGYTTGNVYALATLQNGDLVAGGAFPNRIRRFDGSTWTPLGGGANSIVRALTVLPGGDLVMAGDFTAPADRVARWNGTSWSPLDTGIGDGGVLALATLPDGDVAAGGFFTQAGGAPALHVARFDGVKWSEIDGGTNGNVHALHMTPAGELLAGGPFTGAGGAISAYLARLASDCPATTATVPTGCVGPAGPITLTAGTLPWTGATFESTATGFAPNSIAVSLVGLSPGSTPLSQLFPNALPGCDLLVSTEAPLLHFGSAGTVSYALPLPNDPAFAGLPLHHQFLQVGVDGQGNLSSMSSSNALVLTIGTF